MVQVCRQTRWGWHGSCMKFYFYLQLTNASLWHADHHKVAMAVCGVYTRVYTQEGSGNALCLYLSDGTGVMVVPWGNGLEGNAWETVGFYYPGGTICLAYRNWSICHACVRYADRLQDVVKSKGRRGRKSFSLMTPPPLWAMSPGGPWQKLIRAAMHSRDNSLISTTHGPLEQFPVLPLVWQAMVNSRKVPIMSWTQTSYYGQPQPDIA